MLKPQKRLLAAGIAALVLITALLFIFTAVTVNADSPEWDGTAASSFAGGTGTSDDPYLIAAAEELAYLANQVNSGNDFEGKYIKLTDDILLNSSLEASAAPRVWTPIGNENNIFKGTFDGDGKTVKGIYINTQYSDHHGLFGVSDGTIRNVNVTGSINGTVYVGGVCGINRELGTIENCTNGCSVSGFNFVGGICGTNNNKIKNCSNTGAVSGEYNIGGICGNIYLVDDMDDAIIENCSNGGSVSGIIFVGGVCGLSDDTVKSCSNTGAVSGEYDTGGICGSGYITTNCSNTGSVSGEDNTGGICGENTNIIQNSVNEADVSGESCVGGVCGYNYNTIDSCANIGRKVSASCDGTAVSSFDFSAAGGVCGDNLGEILNSYNKAEVYGSSYAVGGVCGKNTRYDPGLLRSCYNTGFVWGDSTHIGGVCGYNLGDVESCYNVGNVKASQKYAGGVCGANGGIADIFRTETELDGTIKDCYSAGKLIHTVPDSDLDKNVGGICGLIYNSGSTITNCQYNKDLCAYGGTGTEGERDADTDGAKGLSTLEMTCGNALSIMGYNSAVWNKKPNDKGSLIAYYPDLKAFDNDAPSIGYETKLDFARSDGSLFVCGGRLSLDISALVKFDSMADYIADNTALSDGKGDFAVSLGATELCTGTVSDNTVQTAIYFDSAKLLSPEESYTLTLSYSGTNSDYLLNDNSKTAVVSPDESLTHTPAKAADCLNEGNIEYWTLITDSETLYFSDEAGTSAIAEENTVIPATGHNWDRNYSNDEHDHWHKCLNENCPVTDNSQKDGYGKHYSAAPAAEDADEVCAVCGYVITPASVHVHAPSEEYSKDETGHWKTCSGCDEKLDFAKHTFGEWNITTAATAEKDGEKTRECTVCGYTETAIEPKPEVKPITYYPVVVSGNVNLDKPSAAAGETVNVRTDFGYDIIVTAANGKLIAQITEQGSFTMPACKVYVKVVQNDTLALMSKAWSNSYVYSYDSGMNKIKVNSTKKRGVIVINLGEEYAGKLFTIYSGRRNTDVKITEGVLNSNGAYKFEVPDGKNYTLVVED
ncbi:MAG: hypothetical protein MSJ26_08115 [Oscillospiraceae bacterium]|nr:hypothetical protein [Oscillospiraceae bacterium]